MVLVLVVAGTLIVNTGPSSWLFEGTIVAYLLSVLILACTIRPVEEIRRVVGMLLGTGTAWMAIWWVIGFLIGHFAEDAGAYAMADVFTLCARRWRPVRLELWCGSEGKSALNKSKAGVNDAAAIAGKAGAAMLAASVALSAYEIYQACDRAREAFLQGAGMLGGIAGGYVGGTLGSVVPGAGTIADGLVGGAGGGYAGQHAGAWIYDTFLDR
jgi:hypothetical protein